jgi:biopolymer transport protein TolR
MAMTSGSNQGVSAVINVTPLVDVLLVLLIIFMVISPTKPWGLEAQVPQPPKPNTPESIERTIVAEVTKQRDETIVRINGLQVEWPQLQAQLTEIYKGRAERVMFIKGDDDLDFEEIARVIDAANATQLQIRVGLVTRSTLGG